MQTFQRWPHLLEGKGNNATVNSTWRFLDNSSIPWHLSGKVSYGTSHSVATIYLCESGFFNTSLPSNKKSTLTGCHRWHMHFHVRSFHNFNFFLKSSNSCLSVEIYFSTELNFLFYLYYLYLFQFLRKWPLILTRKKWDGGRHNSWWSLFLYSAWRQ